MWWKQDKINREHVFHHLQYKSSKARTKSKLRFIFVFKYETVREKRNNALISQTQQLPSFHHFLPGIIETRNNENKDEFSLDSKGKIINTKRKNKSNAA